MVIDQLRRAAKHLIDRRRLRPSGRRDIGRHRIIVAVDLCDRRDARLVAVAVLAADDDVCIHAVRVDGRIGRLNGRHRRLADVGDRQRAGRVAVRQRVVRAERLAREDKRRDDNVVCHDRRAAVGKGQIDLFLLTLHGRGVKHVDDIDRADVADAVVKMRLDRLAERVLAPLIGRGKLRAEKRARLVDVGNSDRRVHLAFVVGKQVHGRRADIHGNDRSLFHTLNDVGSDLPVNAVFVSHVSSL